MVALRGGDQVCLEFTVVVERRRADSRTRSELWRDRSVLLHGFDEYRASDREGSLRAFGMRRDEEQQSF